MPMRVHRSVVVIPPVIGPVQGEAYRSRMMQGLAESRHPGQERLDYQLGPHLGDYWRSRVLCGGRVRMCVLSAGEVGALINTIIVRMDARGQGFARASLEAVAALADEIGIPLLASPMKMEEEIDLERLRGLFASVGFSPSPSVRGLLIRGPVSRVAPAAAP